MEKFLLPLEVILIYMDVKKWRRRKISTLLRSKNVITKEELEKRLVTPIQYRKIILILKDKAKVKRLTNRGKRLVKKSNKKQKEISLSEEKDVIL